MNTFANVLNLPLCAIPTIICSTLLCAHYSTIASKPFISVSVPSIPNLLLVVNLFFKNSLNKSTLANRYHVAVYASLLGFQFAILSISSSTQCFCSVETICIYSTPYFFVYIYDNLPYISLIVHSSFASMNGYHYKKIIT